MPSPCPEFCLSRAKDAKFEPMAGYREWFTLRDLMECSEDLEIFNVASPKIRAAVDV